jgi:hypothetical protein
MNKNTLKIETIPNMIIGEAGMIAEIEIADRIKRAMIVKIKYVVKQPSICY